MKQCPVCNQNEREVGGTCAYHSHVVYNSQKDIVTFVGKKEGYDMKLVPASVVYPKQPTVNETYKKGGEKC